MGCEINQLISENTCWPKMMQPEMIPRKRGFLEFSCSEVGVFVVSPQQM